MLTRLSGFHHYQILLGCFTLSQIFFACPLAAQGFDPSSDLTIEIEGNSTKFDYRMLWQNQTDQVQDFQFLYPHHQEPVKPQLFYQAEGKTTQIVDNEKSLDLVWESAKTKQDFDHLGLASSPWKFLSVGEAISVPPGKSIQVAYRFENPALSIYDFQALPIWTGQKLSIKLSPKVAHVFTNQDENFTQFENSDHLTWTADWEEKPATLPVIFWSNLDRPKLRFWRDNFVYIAHFFTPQINESKRYQILLDRSGSVYGETWQKMSTWLPEIFSLLGDNSWQLGTIDQNLTWLGESDKDLPKDIIDNLRGQTPLGKNDWTVFATRLEENRETTNTSLVLGDFADFPLEDLLLGAFSNTVVFDRDQNPALKARVELDDGVYVRLFSTLSEKLDLVTLQNTWPWLGAETVREEVFAEIHPEILPPLRQTPIGSHRFLERLPREKVSQTLDPNQELVAFLPTWWGRHQVAKQLENSGEKTTKVEVINSLSYYFGLGLPENFVADFLDQGVIEKAKILKQLRQESPQISIPLWLGAPRYQGRHLSADRATDNLLAIKPWSDLHRKLWQKLSSQNRISLGWGPGEACLEFRCLALSTSGKSAVHNSDFLFWNRPQGQHWADNALNDLAKSNIVEIPWGEETTWLKESVTRGDFFLWVAKKAGVVDQAAIESETSEKVAANSTENRIDRPGSSQAFALTKTPSHQPQLDPALTQAIAWLQEKQALNEQAPLTVDQPLLRVEAAKILLTLNGVQPTAADYVLGENPKFSDLKTWSIPWGQAANRTALVTGYDDGTFRPFQALSRGEAVTLLKRIKHLGHN